MSGCGMRSRRGLYDGLRGLIVLGIVINDRWNVIVGRSSGGHLLDGPLGDLGDPR